MDEARKRKLLDHLAKRQRREGRAAKAKAAAQKRSADQGNRQAGQ